MFTLKFISIMLVFLILTQQTSPNQNEPSKKISTVNVLLPICESNNCNSVYYTVYTEGGCFEWEVDNKDLLSLQQVRGKVDPEGCFHKAIISPRTKNTSENVWLIARDTKTGEQFKCKVGFGKIQSLRIEKTFEKMDVGEISELNVNAYDERGNIFSSIEGFRFNWKLVEGNSAELVKLSHDTKRAGVIRQEVEKKNYSDYILLKGISTGTIAVTCQILEEDYLRVEIVKRIIYVIEPFEIIPDYPLYILPHNSFQFNLKLKLSGRLLRKEEMINYSWSLGNPQCGSISSTGKFNSLATVCDNKLIVKDTRIEEFAAVSTDIHVVYPTSHDIGIVEIPLEELVQILARNEDLFKLLEDYAKINEKKIHYGNNWKLVEGKEYLTKNILLYDRFPVYYGKNEVKFSIEINELQKFISPLKCFYSNEMCRVTANKVTEEYHPLQSTIIQEEGKLFPSPLPKVLKSVSIRSKVVIEKFGRKSFYLPYLGYENTSILSNEGLKSQELRIIVSGGTGKYIYMSNNLDVLEVKENILFGKNLGKATVTITDAEIPTNFDTMLVEVTEVKEFIYFEERQEIELGSDFFVNPIALRGLIMDNDKYNIGFHLDYTFTNCTSLKTEPNLSQKDKDIPQIKDPYISFPSNMKKVKQFFKDNKFALKQKLKFFKLAEDKEDINSKYLKYSNYGICDTKGFRAESEGLVKLSFISNFIIKSSSNKLLQNRFTSSQFAKIYVYSPMSLVSPKIEDIFTKELLNKASIADPHKHKTFILAVNSGMFVKFSGGVVPWTDYFRDYNEEKHVVDPSGKRAFAVDMIKNKLRFNDIANKELYVECLENKSEQEIVVTNRNNEEKSLIRPGKSAISFTVGCYYPKSLSIYFLGQNMHGGNYQQSSLIKEDSSNQVFFIPQQEGIEYFQKKGSIEVARVYAFDENKRLFYNMTSLHGEWTQVFGEGKKLFSVIDRTELGKYFNDSIPGGKGPLASVFETQFKYPEYVHSPILFGNYISRFNLKYTLKKNITSHYVTIKLIDFPSLEPSNSTLYLTESNTLTIHVLNGSGEFEIYLNDDTLANFSYDQMERKITLIPKKEGVLLVNLKDLKINSQFVVSATVYLSDIKKITISGGGLLMMNNSMTIGMKVYDSFDRLFPESEVKKMNLIIKDGTYLEKRLGINYFSGSCLFPNFTVTARYSDTYTIRVQDVISSVTSNLLKIEVFDRLEVFPPYLLMVPGSSYTLSIRGGPMNEENIIKKFEMEDSTIASVSLSEPEVRAHLIGKTSLKVTLIYKYDYNKFYQEDEDKYHTNRTEILTIEDVPVRVDFPNAIEILGAVSRKVFAKSTVRLLAALKKDAEVFTYGLGPFNFEWAVDNTLLAKIRYYTPTRKGLKEECSIKSRSECPTGSNIMAVDRNLNPQNSIGVFLKTFEPGTVDIKLTATITYPDPYTWQRPYIFTINEKIVISDEIYVDIPNFYENDPKKSALYLVPPDVDHELQTNKKTQFRYSVLSQFYRDSKVQIDPLSTDKVISLTEIGRLSTFHKKGMAYVMISQNKESEKDKTPFVPVVLPIFVTDFYSIFIEKSYQLIDMEVGQEIYLKVILQHEYGLLFAEKFEKMKLRVVESHPRVAQAELVEFNSKIKIRAHIKGSSNIILFHPTTRKIYDVFRISVFSSIILPEKIYLNLGATVNFLSKDPSRKLLLSQDAEWSSDDPSIVKIDPIEGIATAMKEGMTSIHLKSKDLSKTKLSTVIFVEKVKSAQVDRTRYPTFFTDIKSSPYYRSEYRIPVKFYIDESESLELSSDANDLLNSIDQKLNFICTAFQSEFVYADSDKSLSSSEFQECLVKIRDIPFNAVIPSNIELIIKVESSQGTLTERRYIYETKIKVPFTSAFRIKNDIHKVTLSKHNRTSDIYIDNFSDLEFKLQDESVVTLEEDKEQSVLKLYVPYNVTSDFNDVKLTIRNKLTDQKEDILLNYMHDQKEVQETMLFGLVNRSSFIDFLTLLILIVIIVILYFYMSASKDEESSFVQATPHSRPPMGSGVRGALNMNRH